MAPAEVTGRKPEVTGYKSGSRAKAKKKKRKRRPQLTAAQLPMPAADAKMLTREEFCARNRIFNPVLQQAQDARARSARDAGAIQNLDHRRSLCRAARRARGRVRGRRRIDKPGV